MNRRYFLLWISTIILLFGAITGYSQKQKYPGESVFKWRQLDDKPHVLWIGGGHWHHTCETCAILRPDLENKDGLHITYSEDTRSLLHLEDYDVVVFQAMLDSLEPEEENALIQAVEYGKPFFSLHAACASFRKPPPNQKFDPVAGHPEFYKMIGGYVKSHPPMEPFKVTIKDPGHPITKGVVAFEILDELFVMTHMQPDNRILLEGVLNENEQPLAWTRKYGEGKVFLLTLGHGPGAANNPAFQKIVSNGLKWLLMEQQD